jgi:hypothetical protein
VCRKARTGWVGVAGQMENTCVRTAHTLHVGYGLLLFIGVKMEKPDNKWKDRIILLAALATIGAFIWAIFTYIVPPKNDTEKVEPPTIIPIPASGENTTIQPHITGENNKIDIDNSRDKTTIHVSPVIMPDSRKSREWPIPDNDNNNATSIKLLERELDRIEKLKEEISGLTQSINKLSQGTCQEKNMARKLYNQRNELETELSNKEKNYNHQASNFNLPHISESNISPYKIIYFSPLDCE